jgi:hypothetical protein
MTKVYTDDNFMYHNCPDAEIASWQNQLIDDYDKDYAPGQRICIDDATPEQWDAIDRATEKARRQAALEAMTRDAEELDLYDDNDGEIMHNPMKKQVNGNHYNKYLIQPAEYCYKNKLNNLQSEAISYITRYPDKGGKVDLEKAIHTLEILIHMEYSDGDH